MKNKFLHKTIAIAFLFSFVANVLLPSIILFQFKVNQEYIAANLCINKDIEESTCKGKCQLKKSLAKVEKSNPNNENFTITAESHITSLFLVESPQFIFSEKINFQDFIKTKQDVSICGYEESLFRPPILC